jgi:tetratricopeptide (TPR) repeat protein
MPHISETQDKYADKGVQIISVSDETLEEVNDFLERKVRGKDEKTYGELTSNYCLTVDPDQSVFEDYFLAAGQNGIPCAFIVGKTGLIEWLGHPMEMDEPLEQVIAGKWDRDAFQAELEKERAKQKEMEKLQRKLIATLGKVQGKLEDGENKEALELLDELIENEEMEFAKSRLQMFRMETLIMDVGGEQGLAALKEFVDDNKNEPMALNQIAWGIYEKHVKDKVDEEILQAATEAAELGVKNAPEDGAILDTLAHLLYETGDLDRAIEVQEKAVENAGDMIDEIEPFLKQLKAEKKAKAAGNSDKDDEDQDDDDQDDDDDDQDDDDDDQDDDDDDGV